MDIGALSSSLAASYTPRTVQPEPAERQRQVARETGEAARVPARPPGNLTDSATNDAAAARRKEARELRETQVAKETSLVSDPRVQFKDSDGTRVMEVYDSKNILIYQVPPKGALTLIHNQENRADTQVQTSA